MHIWFPWILTRVTGHVVCGLYSLEFKFCNACRLFAIFFLSCCLMFSSDVTLQIKKEQTKGRTAPENHTNMQDKPRFERNTLLQTLGPYYFLANISVSESLFLVLTQPPSELCFSCSVKELIWFHLHLFKCMLTSIYLFQCARMGLSELEQKMWGLLAC